MNTVTLLLEFAKTKGIEEKEVNDFLKRFIPTTLEEVLNLPHDMQKHMRYISDVGEPLKSHIKERFYDGNRHERITLERIIDSLYDNTYFLLNDDKDLDIDTVGFENLTTDDENKQEELDKLKAMVQYIIENKFGSVVLDW